jgi:hypothetical protein
MKIKEGKLVQVFKHELRQINLISIMEHNKALMDFILLFFDSSFKVPAFIAE